MLSNRREIRLKNTMQRTIVSTVGLFLLLTIFTACSSSQSYSSSTQTSSGNNSTSNTQTSSGNTSNGNTETRDFTLSGGTQPTLIVNNDVGSVNVQPGSNSNNVHIKVTKSGDNPSDIQTNYSQSGTTVTVTIKH